MTETHPSAHEMWLRYLKQEGLQEKEAPAYESWHFCDNQTDADELVELVLKGIKRATASSLECTLAEGEELPKVGDLSVVTDWLGVAKCVIKTESVDVVPFRCVTAQFAATEGEGDGSLGYWKRVHEESFTRALGEVGLTFNQDTGAVCETFSVVYPVLAS